MGGETGAERGEGSKQHRGIRMTTTRLLTPPRYSRKLALGIVIIGALWALGTVLAFAQTTVVAPTPIDFTPIVQPILAAIGAVIASLLAIYVPKAIAAFQVRTEIELTDQQRATVLGAVQTAAGMVETKLDQGVMQVAHVNVANEQIRTEARAAMAAVPVATAALNMTVDGVARMIVGAVDTSPARQVATPAPVVPAQGGGA
jgi:hypothetical protein